VKGKGKPSSTHEGKNPDCRKQAARERVEFTRWVFLGCGASTNQKARICLAGETLGGKTGEAPEEGRELEGYSSKGAEMAAPWKPSEISPSRTKRFHSVVSQSCKKGTPQACVKGEIDYSNAH